MMLLGWICVGLWAASPNLGSIDAENQREFVAANERALKGELDDAIRSYEDLAARGVAHADLLFNLGNALAQKERWTDAIVAYERALGMNPSDEDARINLAAVKAKIAPPSERPHAPREAQTLRDALVPIVSPLSRDGSALALVVAWVLFFGGLTAWRCFGIVRFRPKVLIVVASLGVLFFGSIVAAHEVVARAKRAVIVRSTPLRAGPHPRFPAEEELAPGTTLHVRTAEGGWLEVQNETGKRGWVPTGDAVLL